MLVLSRMKNEMIIIGDDITIVVVDIVGDKVRLGIDAHTSISVHRKEVYDAIKKRNQEDEPPGDTKHLEDLEAHLAEAIGDCGRLSGFAGYDFAHEKLRRILAKIACYRPLTPREKMWFK